MRNSFMSDQHINEPMILKDASPAHGLAVDNDIDLTLLEDSLRLTPWQRLIENDRALALVRMLEQAKIRNDGTT